MQHVNTSAKMTGLSHSGYPASLKRKTNGAITNSAVTDLF